MTEEHKRKIAEALRGKSKSLAHRRNLSKANMGHSSAIKGFTKETHEGLRLGGIKQSRTKRYLFKEGKLKSWSEGLTKQNSEKVRRLGKKTSRTLKQRYAKGEIKAFGSGLTKETSRIIRERSKKMRATKIKAYAEGKLKVWNKGVKGREYLGHYPSGIWNTGLTKETDSRIKATAGCFKKGENTGIDNSRWTGGRLFRYYGANWWQQREKVRARAKHKCEVCGIPAKDVHHLKPMKRFIIDYIKVHASEVKGLTYGQVAEIVSKEANSPENLKCLCRKHHTTAEAVSTRTYFRDFKEIELAPIKKFLKTYGVLWRL